MIRIETLESGVLHVQHNTSDKYTANVDDLPEEIKDKYYMLLAADAPTRIEGLGVRVTEKAIWIFESEADEITYNAMAARSMPYTKSYLTDISKTFARHGFVPPSQQT